MTPQETFTAISARISGVVDGGRNYMTFDTIFSGDNYNTLAHLVEQCRAIVTDLKAFAADFEASLPAPALAALNRFFALRGVRGLMTDENPPHTLKAALVASPLSPFRRLAMLDLPSKYPPFIRGQSSTLSPK
jgi:hypothetical protein